MSPGAPATLGRNADSNSPVDELITEAIRVYIHLYTYSFIECMLLSESDAFLLDAADGATKGVSSLQPDNHLTRGCVQRRERPTPIAIPLTLAPFVRTEAYRVEVSILVVLDTLEVFVII